jgi:hypothetical protein
MTLAHFTAEQSVYRSSRHYRATALTALASGVRPSYVLPGGTYQQSCFNCTYDGAALTCFCYNEFGGYDQTTLLYPRTCLVDVVNNNGVLGCFMNLSGDA